MAAPDLKDVIDFIIANSEDRKAMDTISNLVFPHTTKYKQNYERYNGGPSASTGAD